MENCNLESIFCWLQAPVLPLPKCLWRLAWLSIESFRHRWPQEVWYKHMNAGLCVDADCIYKFSGFFLLLLLLFLPVYLRFFCVTSYHSSESTLSFPISQMHWMAGCLTALQFCEKLSLETGRSGSEYDEFCPLLALWPGVSYLTPLMSCFLLCEVGIIIPPGGLAVQIKWGSTCWTSKHSLSQSPWHDWFPSLLSSAAASWNRWCVTWDHQKQSKK